MSFDHVADGPSIHDEGGSGRSEHAVHHFHGLILDAYENS